MKKNFIIGLAVGLSMLSSLATAATYGGGNGTAEFPYLIYTAEQLDLLGQTPEDLSGNFCFRQMANINLSVFAGTQFHRLGTSEQAFQGTYDGNGFSISNFTYEDSTADYVGLFGYVFGGASSTIKNVRLVNVHVIGKNRVGALVGSGNCIVQNCSVEGGTITGNEVVGGLLGYAFYSISDCSANAVVTGSRTVGGIAGYFSSSGNYVDCCRSQGSVTGGTGVTGSIADAGGIVGKLYSGTVRRCSSSASVTATGACAGGIVGSTFSNARIENCTATGTITNSHNNTGGIIGELYFSTMTYCRSSGVVSGLDYVGGAIGNIWGNASQINDCVAVGDVSGRGRVGGFAGRLVVNSGTVTLLRCGADNLNVATQTPYGGGLVGEIQANNPGAAIVSQCLAYPDITCNGTSNTTRSYQAGLAGSALRATITNCLAWGSVDHGYQYTGGLVGSMTNCTVSNCYSIGSPSGLLDVGGLVGKASTCTVTNSFWDIWSSGKTASAAGTGLTTTDMQKQATYTTATWDLVGETANGTDDVWRLCNDGTTSPKLTWWAQRNGDFVCADTVDYGDFSYFAQRWLLTGCSAENQFCAGSDMDMSGGVDYDDFLNFLDHWMEEI